MMLSAKRPLTIDDLNANHYMVSVHKYGFFLCRKGTARILLGTNTYQISRNYLCVYAPNTLFQILERSDNLNGILEEDDVDTYHPVLNGIDIRQRLQMRNKPCVMLTEKEAEELMEIYKMVRNNETVDGEPETSTNMTITNATNHDDFTRKLRYDCTSYLRYALCMKVLEVYFGNTPAKAMPQSKEAAILNRFLVSVYEHCHSQRTVQYYADEQCLSPYYFSTIIREMSGKSALQWISDIAMTFARQYLERSEMSIKEIACRMEFPDQSSFGRYFKHHEGCSPSEYRERTMA